MHLEILGLFGVRNRWGAVHPNPKKPESLSNSPVPRFCQSRYKQSRKQKKRNQSHHSPQQGQNFRKCSKKTKSLLSISPYKCPCPCPFSSPSGFQNHQKRKIGWKVGAIRKKEWFHLWNHQGNHQKNLLIKFQPMGYKIWVLEISNSIKCFFKKIKENRRRSLKICQ